MLAEEAQREREKKMDSIKQAWVIREAYVKLAADELPGKRARLEELREKMKVEDGVLEVVDIKKRDAEAAWRAANDEKELREKKGTLCPSLFVPRFLLILCCLCLCVSSCTRGRSG